MPHFRSYETSDRKNPANSTNKPLKLHSVNIKLLFDTMHVNTRRKVAFLSYLSDFAKARGVNRSVLGDGHCIPALILGRTTTAWGVRTPTTPHTSSTHPATRAATRLLLGDKGLLHLHLLPVLFQLSLFVDLVYGLGALVTSPRNPVILGWRERDCEYRTEVNDGIFFNFISPHARVWMLKQNVSHEF